MLIIDTYNVLHAAGVLPPRLAGLGVPGLIRLLSVSRFADRRITLVCDGGPGRASSGVRMDGVTVFYSGTDLEADDLIETLIERYHRGNTLEVVSSDRRLRRAARRRGARAIESERFLGWLVEDEAVPRKRTGHALRRQVPLDVYSVREWCREFGLPDPANPLSAETGPAKGPGPGQGDAEVAPADQPPRTRPGRVRRVRPAPPASIGESLELRLPEPAPEPRPSEYADAGGGQAPLPEQAAERDGPPGPAGAPARVGSFDPVLLAALEEWRERLTLDDLDMRRWTPDADPLDPPR